MTYQGPKGQTIRGSREEHRIKISPFRPLKTPPTGSVNNFFSLSFVFNDCIIETENLKKEISYDNKTFRT